MVGETVTESTPSNPEPRVRIDPTSGWSSHVPSTTAPEASWIGANITEQPPRFAGGAAVSFEPQPLEAIAGQLVSTAPSRAEIRLGCLCYAVEVYKAGQPGTEQMDVKATAQSFADWVEQALE